MTTKPKTLAAQARELNAARKQELAALKRHKELKLKREDLERQLLDRFEAEETDSIKSGGTLFVKTGTTYAQIQDRDAFVAWAKENDEQLLKVVERKGLLNALVHERQDNGEPLPPGVGFYVDEGISQRAA